MKKVILIAFLIFATVMQAQTFQWARSVGGSTGLESAFDIVTDLSGNTYTTGNFGGTVDFDPGPGTFNLTSNGNIDMYILKLDPNGNFIWAISVGGNLGESGRSILVDGNFNVYTTGFFTSTVDFDPGVGTFNLTPNGGTDMFVQKLDVNGNFIWAKSIGGIGNDYGWSINEDNSGNICISGSFEEVVDFDPGIGTNDLTSAGQLDGFILKLDTNGQFLFAVGFGGLKDERPNSFVFDNLDNIIVAGGFEGTADFDPGVGVSNLTSSGGLSPNSFILKLDNIGNFIWAKKLNGNANEAFSVDVNSLNDIIATGYFGGTVDFDPSGTVNNLTASSYDIFVVNLNSAGSFNWANRTGNTGDDRGLSITVDGADNTYITGIFSSTVDFDPGAGNFNLSSNGATDIFTQKLDPLGGLIWAIKAGGSGIDYAYSNYIGVNENVYIAGQFEQITDFDPGVGTYNLTSNGGADVFILKLNSGNCVPTVGTDIQTACDSYTWMNGITYTASNNTSQFTLTNATGCDSVVTLNLTINNSTTATVTETACDSYTWSLNGTMYTSSGTYTHVGTNGAGCPLTTTLNLTINSSTTASVTETACDSYTWALNGTTYTTSGTYTHIGTNGAGCPLTTTLNLTINNSTTASVTETACDSYTWALNGTTYTTSGTYTHVGTNGAGCPLTSTLNLTINNSTTASVTETACDSYTWALNGTTYTNSGTYTHVGTNAAGCPLTTTLNLTINNSTTATVTETACDSYTWTLNGTTYTSSGIYTHVGTNAAGCPLTTTLNLTINNSTTATITETACDSYTWSLNGTTYTTSGTYTHVGTNASGCQLTTTLNLTINSVDVSVLVSDPTITANASGASYQWINCNNGNALIPGATAQAFTPTSNGNYAVIVTNANCTDTSACQMISSVGIDEIGASNIEVYPNPTSGSVNIILGKEYQNASVRLINALGQAILHKTYSSTDEITFEIEGAPGVHFLEIESAEEVLGRIRVVKN